MDAYVWLLAVGVFVDISPLPQLFVPRRWMHLAQQKRVERPVDGADSKMYRRKGALLYHSGQPLRRRTHHHGASLWRKY